MFEGDWDKLQAKICFIRQFWTKYLTKSKETRQNLIKPENSDIPFHLGFDH